ncbi:MAG: hydrogenase maturation nickel metallochaperone HypA [Solirubrobacteraceae bacterium]|jgi:hydrogenase nickel incorporation protein HypA/HybF
MHELSVSSAIVDTAVRHAEGRRVTAVQVRLGRLRQVVPSSLAFYFELVARETVCEGARLDQEVVPAALRCADCAHAWEIDLPDFRCPRCGSADVAVETGEELEVASIEVEEASECTV